MIGCHEQDLVLRLKLAAHLTEDDLSVSCDDHEHVDPSLGRGIDESGCVDIRAQSLPRKSTILALIACYDVPRSTTRLASSYIAQASRSSSSEKLFR